MGSNRIINEVTVDGDTYIQLDGWHPRFWWRKDKDEYRKNNHEWIDDEAIKEEKASIKSVLAEKKEAIKEKRDHYASMTVEERRAEGGEEGLQKEIDEISAEYDEQIQGHEEWIHTMEVLKKAAVKRYGSDKWFKGAYADPDGQQYGNDAWFVYNT